MEPIHFTKTLLEVANKLIVSSSHISGLSEECWFNNSNVYKLIETCLCDYYAERSDFKEINQLKKVLLS